MANHHILTSTIFTHENNMLSSQAKRSPLLWLHNKSCLLQRKVKCFGISLVFGEKVCISKCLYKILYFLSSSHHIMKKSSCELFAKYFSSGFKVEDFYSTVIDNCVFNGFLFLYHNHVELCNNPRN